ncbi:DUF120 domain-containing protein [Billgrantia antri]|uniref:DUF120 domain-containing protein n=1 Tax=Halomonas sulfidivorans TaxID=2733488 RepID=A0ABX7WGX5_9GAMM|nr:DUF120 domain-containing protein [Halomonas sulfidivorans]QTP59613.1 DUF120 domain-containing protein [Halomonas sulfidivorans]
MRRVEGVVSSGRGRANEHITHSVEEIENLTGLRIFPGSLNIVLDDGVKLRVACAKIFDNGRRFIWPACIAGQPVWIYRWQGTPFHIMEILSDKKLREVLNVQDGSKIIIDLDDGFVERMCLREKISTLVIWGFGRSHLYYRRNYTSNRMIFFARRCMRDGQRK